MTVLSDLLARAKTAMNGVTEGPWQADHTDPGVWSPDVIVIGNYTAHDDFDSAMWEDGTHADREFIAATRALVPELVDQCEFLESEFETERDRANQHFDARMEAEARVRALTEHCEARANQLRAFARDCIEHGDMTPGGARMLNSIADRVERPR